MIKVIVVPHTHWDREWYETAARFRQRLVRVMDEVVSVLERDPAFSCFLLDGQAAMLDDYLDLRPAQHDRVAKLASAGRLLVGPWYVLSDELLASDESLVRNLLAGRRVAESVGRPLALGYSPDAFGHPSALPTILAGFGIRHGILWRGYGGEPGQETDVFRWIAPDGSSLVVHHLPPPGYEIGSGLPHDPARLAQRWKELSAMLSPRSSSAVRLIPAGADHHAVEPRLPALLDELSRAAPDHEFTIASPLDYFAGISESDHLPETRGELRFSYRYTWTLQGIHSTRARLKAAIAEGDRLLLRWAEPQAALALLEGKEDARPLLVAAWRDHLLNHPHDSFGGCVTDEVARDIAARASSVIIQARGLLVDLLHERLQQDRSVARRGRARWTPSLVLVNPRPTPAGGVVEATLTVFQDDVIVGSPDRRTTQGRRVPVPGLATADGSPVTIQVLDQYDAFERLDSPRDYPDQDRVRAVRVALQAPETPAHGLRSLRVVASAGAAGEITDPVRADASELSGNGWTLRAGPRAFALSEKGGFAQLVSDRDEGDTYTFQPVEGDEPVMAEWARPRVVWPGPLVAAVAREFTVGDRTRGTVTVRADHGSSLIRVAVDGVNLTGNHRLRIRFPLPKGARGGMATADMQYGPVTRNRASYDLREFTREWPVSTAPMHRFPAQWDPKLGIHVT